MAFGSTNTQGPLAADLDAHKSAKNNPHGVTAAQVKALPLSGGTMTGAIAMGGHAVTGLPDPAEDTAAATKIYVDNAIRTAIGAAMAASY